MKDAFILVGRLNKLKKRSYLPTYLHKYLYSYLLSDLLDSQFGTSTHLFFFFFNHILFSPSIEKENRNQLIVPNLPPNPGRLFHPSNVATQPGTDTDQINRPQSMARPFF